jgi:hypothetical protein
VKAHVDRESLAIAMAVVPGLYSRNRYFSFYGDPEVRRARTRAAVLRGVVRQLLGAQGTVDYVVLSRGDRGAELKYSIASLRLERTVALSDLEAACVAYLASRAGVTSIHASDEDRAKIDGALKRLAVGLRLSGVEAGEAGGVSLPSS